MIFSLTTLTLRLDIVGSHCAFGFVNLGFRLGEADSPNLFAVRKTSYMSEMYTF